MGGQNLMDEKEIIKLFTYMVTSARGCVDEPKIYGPFRLIDSISKLYSILKENDLIENKEVSKIIGKIEEKKYSCMTDEKEFVTMLDDVIDDFVTLFNFNK
jgi:hypothetical protein